MGLRGAYCVGATRKPVTNDAVTANNNIVMPPYCSYSEPLAGSGRQDLQFTNENIFVIPLEIIDFLKQEAGLKDLMKSYASSRVPT